MASCRARHRSCAGCLATAPQAWYSSPADTKPNTYVLSSESSFEGHLHCPAPVTYGARVRAVHVSPHERASGGYSEQEAYRLLVERSRKTVRLERHHATFRISPHRSVEGIELTLQPDSNCFRRAPHEVWACVSVVFFLADGSDMPQHIARRMAAPYLSACFAGRLARASDGAFSFPSLDGSP